MGILWGFEGYFWEKGGDLREVWKMVGEVRAGDVFETGPPTVERERAERVHGVTAEREHVRGVGATLRKRGAGREHGGALGVENLDPTGSSDGRQGSSSVTRRK